MSSKINVLLEFGDYRLRERLTALFAGDLANSWNVVDRSRDEQAALNAQIAVFDDDDVAKFADKGALRIFLGEPSRPEDYFSTVSREGGEEELSRKLFDSAKRAFACCETAAQNRSSLYSGDVAGRPLEKLAHSLTERIYELQRLSDLRLEIIEQLPIGVIGVDNEGTVVLANPKAVELLGLAEAPLWGMALEKVAEGKLSKLFRESSLERDSICVDGQVLELVKSPFLLEKRQAGTILIISRRAASQ